MLSGAVHGRIGLLCNGWRLEAWDFGPEGDTCVVDLDLDGLAQRSLRQGGGDWLPEDQRGPLYTLWMRFSRRSFKRTGADLAEMLKRPPRSDALRAQIQDALDRPSEAAAIEHIVNDYLEARWRENAVDVTKSPEQLVEALRGIIELFSGDVRQQLGDALRRHVEYKAALQKEEERFGLATVLNRIRLHAPFFDFTPKGQRVFTRDEQEEAFDTTCLKPLRDWATQPEPEYVKKTVAEAIGTLEPLFKKPSAGQTASRKQVLAKLAEEIEAYCRNAMELFAAHTQLDAEFKTSIRADHAYQNWKLHVSLSVMVGASDENLAVEFARQTAYVYIIRLLLVRICEDKGLFRRKLSDGGLVLWQEQAPRYLDYASGRSYEYLTRMAYDCALNVFVHFYGASRLFDWYRMDDKMLLRALIVLNAFNLAQIDTDIIGAVYGRYLKEGKHEQGRYYTARSVVRPMLDFAGFAGANVLERRLLDPACGSGSFLVEASRRIIDRYRGPDGAVPAESLEAAVREVQHSLLGIDVNPFACYLAETNLLIQVLDLVREAQRRDMHLAVERFHVYCDDSLMVDEEVAASSDETLILLLGEDRAVPEMIKAKVGLYRDGFDVIVGNPPYVRADESPAYLLYRRLVESQAWFTTAHQKWDLYVPFVEQTRRLLADKPDARACLITIESLGTAPYAMKLRSLLSSDSTLERILFTKHLRLFPDADWQDNLIFSFRRKAPAPAHVVQRLVAERLTDAGALDIAPFDEVTQLGTETDRLFNRRPQVTLSLEDTVRWDEICYVSKGMVLHSDEGEKKKANLEMDVPASYDHLRFKEEIVEDRGKRGKRIRTKPFKRDDLISAVQDEIHTRRLVDSRNVLRGGIGATKWLEYGDHTRCPSRVSRPTFPELYERPKVMFGAFTGVAVHTGDFGAFLVVPHTVRLSVRWTELEGIENRSLEGEREPLRERGFFDPNLSKNYSEWYLAAIAQSDPIQKWMSANKHSMKDDVYPEEIKSIPVKHLPPQEQQPFIDLAKQRHRLWAELTELEAAGFRIGEQIELPVRALADEFRKTHPAVKYSTLFHLLGRGLFSVQPGFAVRDLRRARAAGDHVLVDRQTAFSVGPEVKAREEVADVRALYFAAMPGTFAERQEVDLLPRDEEGLLQLRAWLSEKEAAVRRRKQQIAEIGVEIDRLAWDLYRPQ